LSRGTEDARVPPDSPSHTRGRAAAGSDAVEEAPAALEAVVTKLPVATIQAETGQTVVNAHGNDSGAPLTAR
jgi:hypothetical protein